MDVAVFDASDGLNPAQGRLGRSQGSKALLIAEEPFQGGMIAFDQVVFHFLSICRILSKCGSYR